jgi:hypothetical protein
LAEPSLYPFGSIQVDISVPDCALVTKQPSTQAFDLELVYMGKTNQPGTEQLVLTRLQMEWQPISRKPLQKIRGVHLLG